MGPTKDATNKSIINRGSVVIDDSRPESEAVRARITLDNTRLDAMHAGVRTIDEV
jgi:hypothetical protein